jgi:hypothetical protein
MSKDLDWRSLRLRLEALKTSVVEEIRGYPPPIPACDAQFNRLLELRQLLPQELARLDLAANDKSIAIEDFIRSSPCETELSSMRSES